MPSEPSMRRGQELALDIEELASGGDGLAHGPDGRVIFVSGALAGERVKARLSQVKRDFARAELLQIEKPSPDRVEPACPHYDRCGGCSLQHLAYPAQVRAKASWVERALSRLRELPAMEAAASPLEWGWRHRVRLAVGREGLGFVVAMRTFDKSRPGVGAQAVGVAQGALDEAAAFARTRKQFGKPIITFQAVAHMLADMATEIEAARALVYATARYIDSGAKDFSKVSAMSKVFPSDVAMRVTTNAVQILGGHGYMRDYPVEKMMRDAKILQIYEGTNQIQRNVIGQELNKEYGRKKK